MSAAVFGWLRGCAARIYRRVSFLRQNLKAELFFSVLERKRITDLTDVEDLTVFEQRFHSQNGEDGLIRAIFSVIGETNRFCVEFGIHKDEGNTINLFRKGWACLWMDGCGDGKLIRREYVIAENINDLFRKYDVPRSFDLLSIDIDSNDYYVWKALDGYSPRVVVIEYNAGLGPTVKAAVKYDPLLQWDGSEYFGASLAALERLGRAKGYTLVACDRGGHNAFFVRNDLIADHFAVQPVGVIYRPPAYGRRIRGKWVGYARSGREMVDPAEAGR